MLNDDPFRGEDNIKFCTVIRGLSLRILADLERKANVVFIQIYLLYRITGHYCMAIGQILTGIGYSMSLNFWGPPYWSRAMPAVVERFGG